METVLSFISTFLTQETLASAIVLVILWFVGRWRLLKQLFGKAQDIYNDVEDINASDGWAMEGAEKLELAIDKLGKRTDIFSRIVFKLFGTWTSAQIKDIFDRLAKSNKVKLGLTKKPTS